MTLFDSLYAPTLTGGYPYHPDCSSGANPLDHGAAPSRYFSDLSMVTQIVVVGELVFTPFYIRIKACGWHPFEFQTKRGALGLVA